MPKFKNQSNYEYQDMWEDTAYADLQDQADPGGELDELGDLPPIRNMPRPARRRPRKHNPHHQRQESDYQIRWQLADMEPSFEFTYNVQRDSHERKWLVDSLGVMIHLGWLSDVLRQVKGGKEASVYLCAGTEMTGENYLAAKIYRPRMFRNLRKDHLYREGRAELDPEGNRIVDDGMQRAMARKSEFGQRLSHSSWIQHEIQTMQILHQAGLRMPTPYVAGDNAIMMQYIGNDVLPAPTLNQVDLESDEAQALFAESLASIDLMLAHDRIHGDYSAYNILYWEGKAWVIDFPQAIHPDENNSAYQLLGRDVARICDYFSAQGVKSDPKRLADELWQKYRGRFRPAILPGLLDVEEEDDQEDRDFWEQQGEH